MLYPTIQTVSLKGQMVVPAGLRRALGVRAGTLVLIIPDTVNKQMIVRPMATDDPIEAGFGMFAGETSLLKTLLKTKKEEILLEQKKYVKHLHS